MKTLSFSKDRVRVLVSTELDSVIGGVGFAQPTATASPGGFAKPTATAVSSAKPDIGGFAKPTATAVHHKLSSVKPDSGGKVSSAKPDIGGGKLSSALPSWDDFLV